MNYEYVVTYTCKIIGVEDRKAVFEIKEGEDIFQKANEAIVNQLDREMQLMYLDVEEDKDYIEKRKEEKYTIIGIKRYEDDPNVCKCCGNMRFYYLDMHKQWKYCSECDAAQ